MPSVAVLGTGQVGQAIARRAAEVGYDVTVGARSADSPSLTAFADASPPIATGSYADAAATAPLVVNATNGNVSLDVLAAAGDLEGKVILDLANELRPVENGFPEPVASPHDSLGLRLQQAFPQARVVKALNTMNNEVMVHPESIPGDHLVFLSGDDPAAKDLVREFLRAIGWRDVQMLDLGGIDTAAATEMMMLVWMRVTIARGQGAPRFNWAVLAAD